MGKCFSSHQEEDDGGGGRSPPEGEDTNNSFSEEERRKTRAGGAGSGDEERCLFRRRASSGLSSYSVDGRHVIENPFSIAAFNVQRFGLSKMGEPEVVEILVRLVRKFDVMLVQEVVDVTGKSVESLLQKVNLRSEESGIYGVSLSERVGRGVQKEQYAVFYREDKVKILDSLVYSDPGDEFAREPYIVRMKCESLAAEVDELVLICIHTQPKSANSEIDLLFDVHNHVKTSMCVENIIILGDFNASGAYIRSQDWRKNRLRGAGFKWLIPDHLDTTATNTLAAYDRIVLSGEKLIAAVTPESGNVYRYDEEFTVMKETLLKVSDHYPVWFSLKPSVHPIMKKFMSRQIGILLEDRRFPNVLPQQLLNEFQSSKFKMRALYDDAGRIVQLDIRSQKFGKLQDLGSAVQKLRETNRNLVSYSILAALKHQMKNAGSLDYDLAEDEKGKFTVSILLDLQQRNLTCTLLIKANL